MILFKRILPEIQKDNSDWLGCLSVFLSTVINQMGIRECQSEAVKVIQTCLTLCPETSSYVVKQIADTGVSSGWPSVASSVIKLLPQMISEALNDIDHAAVIEALFHRLNDQHVGPGALNALKRYKEIPLHMGDRTFEFYVRKIPEKHRKLFDLMCSNGSDHQGGRRKKKREANVVYGAIPKTLYRNFQTNPTVTARERLLNPSELSLSQPSISVPSSLICQNFFPSWLNFLRKM